MTVQVLCLLVTHTCEVIGNAFYVSLPNSDCVTVEDLLEKVNEKASPLINRKYFAADASTPWKPYSFFPAHPPTHLSHHVKNLYLNDKDKCAAFRLEKGVTLEESFAGPLPSKHVHIVVQLPPKDPIPGLLSSIMPGFEQHITFDLEDIKTYKNPPFSALDRNEILVATSSIFVAEFENMLRKKRLIKRDDPTVVIQRDGLTDLMTTLMKLSPTDKFEFEVDQFFFELDGEPADPLDVAEGNEMYHYLYSLLGTGKSQEEFLLSCFNSGRESALMSRFFHFLPCDEGGFHCRPECVFSLVITSKGCIPSEKWTYPRKHVTVLTVLDVPNMIVDVESDEDGRCRTLLEAVCLVRLANALRIDQSIPFIVTAIYVDDQLLASRYLVFQPDSISKREVCYTRTDFDLKDPRSTFEFCFQLYNLNAAAKKQSQNLHDPEESARIIAAGVETRGYPPVSLSHGLRD